MKCKDCKNLKNRFTYGQCYAHEGGKICRDSDDCCFLFEPIPQTNGDRFRAMSNEELAEYMYDNGLDCDRCIIEEFCKHIGLGCKGSWLKWLNSPAESEEKR